MKVNYFADTDTAYIQFTTHAVAETKDLSPNIILDLDAGGNVVGMTIEHASQSATISELSFQRISEQSALSSTV